MLYLSLEFRDVEFCIEPLMYGRFDLGKYHKVTKELLEPKIRFERKDQQMVVQKIANATKSKWKVVELT